MKQRSAILIFFLGLATLSMPACSNKNDRRKPSMEAQVAAPPSGHEHPGHMHSEISSDTVMLSPRDEEYSNITVDTARIKTIAENTSLVGITNFDERNITVVTCGVPGRLEHFFARTPQQHVTAGEPLYALYSEELLSNENEFINALQQPATSSDTKHVISQLIEGARKKLILLGLTEEKIKVLERTHQASALDTFYSPRSGIIIGLPVSEGQYVDRGSALLQIADLSHLWIETQMYTNELQWLNQNPTVSAEFDAYPGRSYRITPVFDNPAIESDQKISLVRFLVGNKDGILKPGMMAYVSIRRNETKTLVVPKSSLLMGEMTVVWVKVGEGIYESRTVGLGVQNRKEVEVTEGLKEGDIVVTNGAFLLNSALVLKKGAGMEGMKM